MMTMLLLVEFDRIGRNHLVEPLTIQVDRDHPCLADEIAKTVYGYAFNRLASRNVDVSVDLSKGTGQIYAGIQNGGTFTIAQIAGETKDGRPVTTPLDLT